MSYFLKAKAITLYLAACTITLALSACGFHLQGEVQVAQPLKLMYLKTPDPYGYLARNLRGYLQMSHVKLVSSASQAQTQLVILHDDTSQEFLTVSGTQTTRQYKLLVTVIFEITDREGRTLLPAQTLVEKRTITIQANQILGSSNVATLYFQQMRRALAYAIMNRLSSTEVTHIIDKSFTKNGGRKL
jgi:LPS-assembly lipoprotein